MSLAGVRGELATPMPPYERTAALVTLYCEDGGALGYYRDETRHSFVLRLPVDTAIEPGPLDVGGAEAIAELSRHTKAEIDAVLDTLLLRRWHPDARNYVYLFNYNAEIDQVDLSTNAPPELVAPLLTRFPDSLTIQFGPSEEGPHPPR
jgi:hypothetical protein